MSMGEENLKRLYANAAKADADPNREPFDLVALCKVDPLRHFGDDDPAFECQEFDDEEEW